ncbi:MAG: hypothetical protein FJ356_04095 [Thaumarchaeota archaeon]|nr:hypothetical protein [Nitrososphaerota archaeon]
MQNEEFTETMRESLSKMYWQGYADAREDIAVEIEAIDLGTSSQINGLGVRMIATKIARGN